MKISPNFHDHEFVPPQIYKQFGDNSKWFIRPEIVKLAEFYRKYFGKPVTVNNYIFGGGFSERGYRVPDSKVGSKYSQHKLGAAFDCNIKGVDSDEVRDTILKNQKLFIEAGLTTIEHKDYSPTWLHSDIRPTGFDYILIVKPSITVSETPIYTEDYYISDGDTSILMNIH